MKRILYSSAEIRREIIKIFKSSGGRRVAISAFVGEGADAYLPNPDGLQIICWPKAGSTNPDVLRKLMKSGVRVFLADTLHMKVYWSENQGAVLTSANLSTNALGSGNLKEIGILLASEDIDIDRLISSINPRLASEVELLELDRLHKSYMMRNPSEFKGKHKIISFIEWYESPLRPEWKIGWFGEYGHISLIAKERSMKEYGVGEPENFMSARKGEFKEGDWILSFRLKRSPGQLEWISVDYIVDVPKSDKDAYDEEYHYQAVQVHPKNRYPPPPFRIMEKRFKKAFSKAIREFGVEKLKRLETAKPHKDLVDLIYKNYRT